MRNPAATNSRNPIRIATVPSRPSSSPIAEKMKSVDAFGILSGLPSPKPVPANPPEPNENNDWTIWYPSPPRPATGSPTRHPLLDVAEDLVPDRRAATNKPAPASRNAVRSVAM